MLIDFHRSSDSSESSGDLSVHPTRPTIVFDLLADLPYSTLSGRRSWRGLSELQSEFRQWRNTRHNRRCQRNRLRLATAVYLLRDPRCSADVFLDKIARKTYGACCVNIDDLAQLVYVPLHRANRLYDPDLRRDFGREVTDLRKRCQCRWLGAGADDVAHQRRVVELVLKTGKVERGAEEAELQLIRCCSHDLHRDQFRDELRDCFDGAGDVACFSFKKFEAAGSYRTTSERIGLLWVCVVPLDSGTVRLLTLILQ